MAIGIGETPEGAAAPPAEREDGIRREGSTRRYVVSRGLRAGALTAALAPPLTAFRALTADDAASFDRVHRGRRIRGTRDAHGHWHVTLDGRPLHLMRRADGTWLSMVDHYCSYPAPLDAARAAVDALAPGEQLRGGGHGVRA